MTSDQVTPKQAIHASLTSWIEAHHVPGGYGGRASLPDPTSFEGGPWGYLKACLVEGEVYFRFLQHPSFAHEWLRAIADLAQGRVFAMLPPGAVLADASAEPVPKEQDEAAREAIRAGAVVGHRTDEAGEPEYLVLSPPTAEAAVYLFGAKGHRKAAASVAAFVTGEVDRIRSGMPEAHYFGTEPNGAPVGYAFGAPPGLTAAEWPRHREGGFPLAHGLTIELPEAYRVRKNADGVPFVAISFFHPGDAEAVGFESPEGVAELFENDGEGPTDDPLLAAVAAHAKALAAPPSADRYVHTFLDPLGHTHAFVFHTEASYRAPRATFPEVCGDHDLGELYGALNEPEAALYRGANPPHTAVVQLGRPLHPMQGDEAVRAMGYFVLELACDAGGANFADGSAQYDLESGAFDWAC